MKTSKTVAKLLFVVGALVYLLGLWISCPLLSGKGYFLGVLMTATFGNYAYLRAEKLGQLDDFFYPCLPVGSVNHNRSLVYRCFKCAYQCL